jgi:CelD/BcsL family acetyltransferase involved in cellulose biosynthesis
LWQVPDNGRACYDVIMNERERKEREGIAAEVAFAAGLSDADRIRTLRDLLRTADAIHNSKSAEERKRDEEIRRHFEEPGRRRYIALCERLG